MNRFRNCIALLAIFLLFAGCRSVETFPERPLRISGSSRSETFEYDLNHNGAPDYKETTNAEGRVVTVEELPDKKSPGWTTNLNEVSSGTSRHLIFLLDGVPYDLVRHLYEKGFFRAFHPPQKVISCFPPMTDPAFAMLFHAGAPLGFEAQYYDKKAGKVSNGQQVFLKGLNKPGEAYMQYTTKHLDAALQYLAPEYALGIEIRDIVKDFRKSKDRVFFGYFASTAGMGTDQGRGGIIRYLERLDRLTHQLIREFRGDIKVTMLADHGHTLMPAARVRLGDFLKKKGFKVKKKIRSDKDVVLIEFGLVTNAMLYTRTPGKVADALLENPAVNLCIFPEGKSVVVESRAGKAKIFERDGRFRYDDSGGDPLELGDILQKLKAAGAVDENGFVDEARLFEATVDHKYPDPLARVWQAFHGLVKNPPDLAVTLFDNYFNGSNFFSALVKVKSTHGSLNNVNMTTFIMSTARPFERPLGMEEVRDVIEEMVGEGLRKVSGK